MQTDSTIPKIQTIAVLLIIAFFANLLFGFFARPFLLAILSEQDYGYYQVNIHVATIITVTLNYILNIIVAIWTFKEAKRQNEPPLTWTVFALFFGLIAVVLFYLFLVIKELRAIKNNLEQTNKQKD